MLMSGLSSILGWASSLRGGQVPFLDRDSSINQPTGTGDHAHSLSYIDGVRSGTHGVALDVWVRNGTRNDTAPFLGGLLFEDISQSGDGGLYAELIRNRAFQGSGIAMDHVPGIPYRSITYAENPTLPFGPVLDGWSAIGDVRLSLDLLHPLSESLQVVLQVDVPLNATGRIGFQNDGWWGIPISQQTYNASFWAQASGVRFNWTMQSFDVELRSALEDRIWCSKTIPIEKKLNPYSYGKFETQLPCNVAAPNINNTFAITFDAETARGQTMYFDLISLFPPTYKDRPNGLRNDLAEKLEAMTPKFLRFPGGNNMEGYSVQRRWKWWKTIGPLEDRPGRPGDWSYYNTDGLGLLEYLIWCEDMNMEPLLAVHAGFSLDIAAYDASNSTDANEASLEQMPAVLQEALHELEYCMGDPQSTYWGRQRALHGHPEPFKIRMIEIGNEDWFSHHYPMRAKFMYDGLKNVYPDVTFVFSSFDESKEFKLQIPKGGVWDQHVYAQAGWFVKHHNYWDNFQNQRQHDRPNHPTDPPDDKSLDRRASPKTSHVLGSLMEYHASAVGVNGVINRHPRMGAAVAEAVYAIGGERNPSTYKLSCFAPLMQNLNAWRGTPYDILFTSNPSDTVLSTSYWQQWLFNRYPGKQTLPVTERGGDGLNPLYWVASIEPHEHKKADNVYFKIVNAGNTTQYLKVHFDVDIASMNGTILEPPTQGDLFAYNYIQNHVVLPQEIPIANIKRSTPGNHGNKEIEWEVPAFSISVLQFDLDDHYAS